MLHIVKEDLYIWKRPDFCRRRLMRKERLVGIIMSIIISAVMGAVSAVLVIKNNPESVRYTPAAMIYVSNIALSIVIGVIIALVIPLGRLGAMLARKANANPPGIIRCKYSR